MSFPCPLSFKIRFISRMETSSRIFLIPRTIKFSCFNSSRRLISFMAAQDEILRFLSGTFNIPADIFIWPKILFNFIFPLIALIVIFYTILARLRIFRYRNTVNMVLAVVISFLTIGFTFAFPANILLAASVLFYFILAPDFSMKKMIVGIALAAVIFIGYGYVVAFLPG